MIDFVNLFKKGTCLLAYFVCLHGFTVPVNTLIMSGDEATSSRDKRWPCPFMSVSLATVSIDMKYET